MIRPAGALPESPTRQSAGKAAIALTAAILGAGIGLLLAAWIGPAPDYPDPAPAIAPAVPVATVVYAAPDLQPVIRQVGEQIGQDIREDVYDRLATAEAEAGAAEKVAGDALHESQAARQGVVEARSTMTALALSVQPPAVGDYR